LCLARSPRAEYDLEKGLRVAKKVDAGIAFGPELGAFRRDAQLGGVIPSDLGARRSSGRSTTVS
jgi:hypothetical protein